MAEQEIVNIGTLPNDGSGDTLRVAFAKINNNFTNLFATATSTQLSFTSGLAPNQVIWEVPVTDFAHGAFQIRSGDPGTANSQDITITAHIINDLSDVKFSGFGTTFNGDPVSTYDMDVSGGNVRLLASPLVNDVVQHFISSTIAYANVEAES